MKNNLIKSFILFLTLTLVFSTLLPSLAQATEVPDMQVSSPLSQGAFENNVTEEEVIDDYLDTEKYFDNILLYEDSSAIYQNDPEIKGRNWLRLLFSVGKDGINYIVKVTSKGNKIKNVRNGKLKIDVDKHINAGNRFKNYGNMDKLVEYIVEDIRRLDDRDLAKDGWNSIKTMYGETGKKLEIRFFIEDGTLLSFNAFPDHSKKEAGNVVWLVPQY